MKRKLSLKELLVCLALQNQIKAFAEVLVEDRERRRRNRLIRTIEKIKGEIELAEARQDYNGVDGLLTDLLEVQVMLDLM